MAYRAVTGRGAGDRFDARLRATLAAHGPRCAWHDVAGADRLTPGVESAAAPARCYCSVGCPVACSWSGVKSCPVHRIEAVVLAAELAANLDLAGLGQDVVHLRAPKAAQHAHHALTRAGAGEARLLSSKRRTSSSQTDGAGWCWRQGQQLF